MTEAEMQAAVVDLAMHMDWMVQHARPARTDKGWRTAITGHAGFPDLVLVHPEHGVLFRELKSDKGRLSDAQTAWIVALTAAGADVAVWRPKDWDTVVAVLTGGRGMT